MCVSNFAAGLDQSERGIVLSTATSEGQVNRGQLECLQTPSTYSSHTFGGPAKILLNKFFNKLRRPQWNTQHLNLMSGSDGDSWDWTFLGTIGIHHSHFAGFKWRPSSPPVL